MFTLKVSEPWIFSDITADGFRWENVIIRKDGTRIQDCEIH